MTENITDFARFITIGCLILVLLKLLIAPSLNHKKIAFALFTFCVISYLIVDFGDVMNSWLQYIFIFTALILPVTFWLFSQALFEDHFEFNRQKMLISIISSFLFLFLFLAGKVGLHSKSNWIKSLLVIIQYALSFSFVIAGAMAAALNLDKDLNDRRIKFRKIYFLTVTIIIVTTLITELRFMDSPPPGILDLLQKFGILLLAFLFAFSVLDLHDRFIVWESVKLKSSTKNLPDQKLLDKLNQLMSIEKVWTEEQLTIGKLSSMLDIKEYKLRQCINQYLGFNNFNDYLNSYRIDEACKWLENPSKNEYTIVEIAYKMGFNSLSPFNKSFKRLKGVSPTEYRKNYQ